MTYVKFFLWWWDSRLDGQERLIFVGLLTLFVSFILVFIASLDVAILFAFFVFIISLVCRFLIFLAKYVIKEWSEYKECIEDERKKVIDRLKGVR